MGLGQDGWWQNGWVGLDWLLGQDGFGSGWVWVRMSSGQDGFGSELVENKSIIIKTEKKI
ncbi:hypothetical protein Hanom_Chr04g00353331 [Helianthus anomalus]